MQRGEHSLEETSADETAYNEHEGNNCKYHFYFVAKNIDNGTS